ncbi:MAG: 16S rRNA (uracil(1498)-N(3))-methyltransferase [Armatimonadetes bacterium]|nr:16S rRNA (uracil(1498)-N(3))-methyltransferase [Armatimonadota bacterium]
MGRRRVPQALTPRALPRFFVPPATLQTRTLPDAVAHQVSRVLRLGMGDWICLLDGVGGVYLAQLGESGRIESLQPSALATELPFAVTVLQAMARPEKAETAIRLCVQAGARAIWLAPSERSVAQLEPAKQQSRESRWQRIAQEEAELACRARSPEVRVLSDWAQAFAGLPRPVFVLDEWEGATPLKQRARRMPMPDALSLVVGPEGGFSPDERAWMTSQPETYAVSLGARVLRTEHAACYALAQLAALWE